MTCRKRIFLMVSGLSPQIVTETLYAFYISEPKTADQYMASEVHLITTAEGANRARLSLLTSEKAQFHRLVKEYDIQNLTFTSDNIHIMKDKAGASMLDIRTPEENAAAADYITNKVREFTSEEHYQLNVSLAGGRKTMGYYAGYALSLFGRKQDTLSHVLVSENYENHPEFFYPTIANNIIHTRDGKPLDTSEAKISLARIPFVRLRKELPETSLLNNTSFNRAVDLINAADERMSVTVNMTTLEISLSQQPINLDPAEKAFYLWMLWRQRYCNGETALPDEYEPNQKYGEQLLKIMDENHHGHRINDRTRESLSKSMDREFFQRRNTAIKKALKQQLGQSLADKYTIQRSGSRSAYNFYFAFEDSEVQITGGFL